METCFDNFSEEINSLTTRMKKDKNFAVWNFCRSKVPSVKLFDGEVLENSIQTVFELKLKIITKEGYILEGSSNKAYIPDVLTRLYQYLESSTKSYKEHKVFDGVKIKKTLKFQTSSLIYSDNIAECILYSQEILQSLWERIPESHKKSLHFCFKVRGVYDISLQGNSLGSKVYFDNFTYRFAFEIFLRENPEERLQFVEIADYETLIKKTVDIDAFYDKLLSFSDLLLQKYKDIKRSQLTPNYIVFDGGLTSKIIDNFFKKKVCSTKFKERIREYGIYSNIPLNNEIADENPEDETYISTQVVEIVPDLLSNLQEIRKNLNGGKILYLTGDLLNHGNNLLYINSKFSLYLDGKSLSRPQFNTLEVSNLKGLNILKDRVQNSEESENIFSHFSYIDIQNSQIHIK